MSSLYNSSDDAAFLASTHRHKAASHSHVHLKPHVDSQQPQLSESPRSRGSAWGRAETVYVWECVCLCALYDSPSSLPTAQQSRRRVNPGEWRMVRNSARTSDYSRSELSDLDEKKLWRSSRSRNRQVHTTYNNSWLVLQNMSPSLVCARNNAPHCVTTTPAEFSVTAGSKTRANRICSQFVCWFSVWRL